MRLLVYLRDGRTCYRITGRGVLTGLVRKAPGHEESSVYVERGTLNAETGDYFWVGARLRNLSRGSISHVEEDPDGYPAEAAAA